MSPEEYKAVLAKYVPSGAVDVVYEFMNCHGVKFHISRERSSKYGDYRWPQPRHSYHEISVNGNLNRYHFFMVLLHEMAHLNTYLIYGNDVQPHGHEWQEQYRKLLKENSACFPDDIATLIDRYTERIPLSRTVERQLDAQVRHYDQGYKPEDDVILDKLEPGALFRLAQRPEYLFKALSRRRTRWVCLNLNDGKEYLVHGAAKVLVSNSSLEA